MVLLVRGCSSFPLIFSNRHRYTKEYPIGIAVLRKCSIFILHNSNYSFLIMLNPTANMVMPLSTLSSGLRLLCFFFFFFFFFLFTAAALVAYGSSQAKGQIGAAAVGLQYSHGNIRWEPHLQPISACSNSESGQVSNPKPYKDYLRFLTC